MTISNRDELVIFEAGQDWDAAAHVRLLRQNSGASSGYTADLIDRLHTALRRLASSDGGVKVRDLEWREYSSGGCEADVYSISNTYRQGPRKYALARGSAILGYFDEIDAAKSAAQRDYEVRILSALDM